MSEQLLRPARLPFAGTQSGIPYCQACETKREVSVYALEKLKLYICPKCKAELVELLS